MPNTEEIVAQPEQKPKPKRMTLAQVHCHFNINGGGDIASGEVTAAEQTVAIERFIRWHERQVAIGKDLLAQLRRAESKAEPRS